jgi:hypothetical protein
MPSKATTLPPESLEFMLNTGPKRHEIKLVIIAHPFLAREVHIETAPAI